MGSMSDMLIGKVEERRRNEPIQAVNPVYQYRILVNAVSYQTRDGRLEIQVSKQELLRLAASFHRVVEVN